MRYAEAISKLRSCTEDLRTRGATALYLFGSVARDEAGAESDLDLFIDYDPASRFSLLDLAGIKNRLEDELAVKVDMTTRDSLHPLLRDDIERAAVRIY